MENIACGPYCDMSRIHNTVSTTTTTTPNNNNNKKKAVLLDGLKSSFQFIQEPHVSVVCHIREFPFLLRFLLRTNEPDRGQ